MIYTPGVSLETRRLVLRPFDQADLDGVMAYHLLPDVQRYVERNVRDRAGATRVLDEMCRQVRINRPGETLALAIALQKDGGLAGQVTLHWYDATASQAEVRIAMNPRYRLQGLATEALAAVLDIAFDHFRFHRVFARCDGRSAAAAKLLRNVGMRLEAHFREHALYQGEWDDELHFALLSREWRRSAKVVDLIDPLVA